MPWSLRLDPERNWVIVTLTGPIAYEEWVAQFKQRHAEGYLNVPTLIDALEATPAFSAEDVRTYAEFARSLVGGRRYGPVATVVGTDLFYGMLRMYELRADKLIVASVFRSRPEAEQWLKSHERNPAAR
jgi:hypothetical protein